MPRNKSEKYLPIEENQRIQFELDTKLRRYEEWGNEQLKTSGTKDHLSNNLIGAVKEAVVVQEKFTADMKHLKNLLITLSENSKITDNEERIIDNYIDKIDELIRLYNELNDTYPLIIDKNTSPEDVIQRLYEKYNSPQFYAMMEQLASLQYDRDKIDSICIKYEDTLKRKNVDYFTARITFDPSVSPDDPTRKTQSRDLSAYTAMPMQNLPRVSMVIRAINQELIKFRDADPLPDYHIDRQPDEPSIEHLLALTSGCLERSGSKNSQLQKKIGENIVAYQVDVQHSSKESGLSIEQKQAFFLRGILELNFNTPIVNDLEARVKDFPAYLEEVLVQCYPKIFAFNTKKGFLVKAGSDSGRYLDINNAIGFHILDEENLAQKITLNPAQFDAEALDKLYETDHNVLWLVLKSTKPIDPNFTTQDKVNAYIELAQAYKDQKIGEKEKYLGAYNMAQAAFAVAENDVNCQRLVHEFFGPQSELGQWMISKHSKQDQEQVIENLSKYSYVQYIKSEKPQAKQVISPSQALLLLIDHYENEPEKVAELKKLYLVGVRIELDADRDSRVFIKNAEDLEKINQYFADDYLSSYKISDDKKIINNDPTRRYFETHLAYETVKHQIDNIDAALLKKQVHLLREALIRKDPESEDVKECERAFSGAIHEGDSDAAKEYVNYFVKIRNGEFYGDFTEEQRQKIILLAQSSLLGVTNAKARRDELPIQIYGKGLYADYWRGKEKVYGQDTTANPHMGLMKNHMPIVENDIATSINPAPSMRAADQATFVDTGYAKWVEMNFAGLVHPFSNAISGTVLCLLRNLAEQHNGDEIYASGITNSAEEIERYTRLVIAVMLYVSGGHSLSEYTYPLQLDEVRSEFNDVGGFTDINLGAMFLDHNTKAFDAALNDAVTYNARLLQKQRLHQDIKYVGLSHDELAIAKSINAIVQIREEYESEVKNLFLSKYTTSSKKVDIIKHVLDEMIEVLKEGNVKGALSMSNELMKRLEQEYGKIGFTGGEKKSYLVAKEIHDIVSTLDKKLSIKENIDRAGRGRFLFFKEQPQPLKAQEEKEEKEEKEEQEKQEDEVKSFMTSFNL